MVSSIRTGARNGARAKPMRYCICGGLIVRIFLKLSRSTAFGRSLTNPNNRKVLKSMFRQSSPLTQILLGSCRLQRLVWSTKNPLVKFTTLPILADCTKFDAPVCHDGAHWRKLERKRGAILWTFPSQCKPLNKWGGVGARLWWWLYSVSNNLAHLGSRGFYRSRLKIQLQCICPRLLSNCPIGYYGFQLVSHAIWICWGIIRWVRTKMLIRLWHWINLCR